MTAIFFSFWWLIFPLMGFVFGGWGMFLNYRRSQQAMEVLKAYAAQGKDPPPEVMAAVTGAQAGMPPPASPYAGYPPPYAYGWGWGRWGWRGPYWVWSRVITFSAIAIGFTLAGKYWGDGDADAAKAFHLVAIIMGVLAVGFGAMAVMQTLMSRNAPKP